MNPSLKEQIKKYLENKTRPIHLDEIYNYCKNLGFTENYKDYMSFKSGVRDTLQKNNEFVCTFGTLARKGYWELNK